MLYKLKKLKEQGLLNLIYESDAVTSGNLKIKMLQSLSRIVSNITFKGWQQLLLGARINQRQQTE